MEVIQRIFRHRAWIALVLICAVLVPPAFAQEDDELRLMVRRTFGYRGGDAIQGKFSLEVEGPAELVQVTFVIDRETMAEDQEPPLRVQFRHQRIQPWVSSADGDRTPGKRSRAPHRRAQF